MKDERMRFPLSLDPSIHPSLDKNWTGYISYTNKPPSREECKNSAGDPSINGGFPRITTIIFVMHAQRRREPRVAARAFQYNYASTGFPHGTSALVERVRHGENALPPHIKRGGAGSGRWNTVGARSPSNAVKHSNSTFQVQIYESNSLNRF